MAKAAKSSRVKEHTPALADRGTGYSGTPLATKLGIKAGHSVGLFDVPDSRSRFEKLLTGLPPGVTIVHNPAPRVGRRFDVIVSFHHNQTSFGAAFASRAAALSPTGGLWFAWPKKASGVKTDLTETIIRDTALAAGLVDNKVCAIDSVWSGLRIVVRVEDRPKTSAKKQSAARQQPPK